MASLIKFENTLSTKEIKEFAKNTLAKQFILFFDNGNGKYIYQLIEILQAENINGVYKIATQY